MPRNSTGDRAGNRSGEPPAADGVAYNPAVITDWDDNVDPGNVDAALDQLAERVAGGVTAGANIADHSIVRGDGGAKGVQDSGVLIDDNDNITIPGSTHSIGAAGTDTTLTFVGTVSGIIEWDQTNNRFVMADKIRMNDDIKIVFGGSEDASVQYRAHGTYGNLQISIVPNGDGGCTGYISILDKADIAHANRNPAGNSVDPVLRVYSSDSAEANDYVELYHNQTDGVIKSGSGLVLDGGAPIKIPATDGDAGQYLKTDGAGTTSWDTPTGAATKRAHTFYFANPQAGKSYVAAKLPAAATITRIDFVTIGAGSTLVFNVEIRAEATPETAGTDVWAVDDTADDSHEAVTSFTNDSVAAHELLVVTVVSLGGTVPDGFYVGIELEDD